VNFCGLHWAQTCHLRNVNPQSQAFAPPALDGAFVWAETDAGEGMGGGVNEFYAGQIDHSSWAAKCQQSGVTQKFTFLVPTIVRPFREHHRGFLPLSASQGSTART